jgi:sterol 3beta-glucosyltransferase/vancomycin aglycone glucosyltransferase
VRTTWRSPWCRSGSTHLWTPHGKLLPRCAAIVHHGGAGTTHAALRAGRPSVILAFIFEQKLWGRHARRAGAATEPLSFWKATPEKVAARIHEATASEGPRDLARAMEREDGTGLAVRLLEELSTQR